MIKILGTSNILNNDLLGKNLSYSNLQDLTFSISKCTIPYIRVDCLHCDITDILKVYITDTPYGLEISYLNRSGNTITLTSAINIDNPGDYQTIFESNIYLQITNDGFNYDNYSFDVDNPGEIIIIPNVKFNSFLAPYNMETTDSTYTIYSSFVVMCYDDITKLELNSINNQSYCFINTFAIEEINDTFNMNYTADNITAFPGITYTANPYIENITAGAMYQVYTKTVFNAFKTGIKQTGIFNNQVFIKLNSDSGLNVYLNSAMYQKGPQYYYLYKALNQYTGGTVAVRTKSQGINWDVAITPPAENEIRTYRITELNEYGIESYNVYNDYQYTVKPIDGISQQLSNIAGVDIIEDNGICRITGNYTYENDLNRATHVYVNDGINSPVSFKFDNFLNHYNEFDFTMPYNYQYDKTITFTYCTYKTDLTHKSTNATINATIANWNPANTDIIENISSSFSLGINPENNFETTFTTNGIELIKTDGLSILNLDGTKLYLFANELYYMMYGLKLKSGLSPVVNNNLQFGCETVDDFINIVVKGKTVAKIDTVNGILECFKFWFAGILQDSLPSLPDYPGLYISDNAIYIVADDLKNNYKDKVILKIDQYGYITSGIRYSSIFQ